jgi:broad specificity phosphatase PhoE/ADP-ribose pyrophosphatase YjhB (NUDIX family)
MQTRAGVDNLVGAMTKTSKSGGLPETHEPIKASGGVVLRSGSIGPEILVVHRKRYDDWSLPKGKDEPGETPQVAALREVIEETGQPVRVIAPLRRTQFDTGSGIKDVDWFAMRATRLAEFIPNDEVDQALWFPVGEVDQLLSYEVDRSLVGSIDPEALLSTGTLFLVRHGAAGERDSWEGDDRLRPLSNKGERQAKGIAALLAGRDIELLVSSPYVRCRQTVQPLAEELGLDISEDEALAEGAGGRGTRGLVRTLAGANAVLCSHGDVIPALIDWMAKKGMSLRSPDDCKKGSIWEVDVRAGEFRKARYLPPPEA